MDWTWKLKFQFCGVAGIVCSFPVDEDLAILARDTPILCMEYCSGGDLRQVLSKPIHCSGLPEKDVMDILSDISSAVKYLHSKNVVHRDLKPENVVIQLNAQNNKVGNENHINLSIQPLHIF